MTGRSEVEFAFSDRYFQLGVSNIKLRKTFSYFRNVSSLIQYVIQCGWASENQVGPVDIRRSQPVIIYQIKAFIFLYSNLVIL